MNSNDLGFYVSNANSLSDPEKYSLIKNIWKPSRDFVFPDSIESQGRKRRFRRRYLIQYNWLVYSKYFDGCFCLPGLAISLTYFITCVMGLKLVGGDVL